MIVAVLLVLGIGLGVSAFIASLIKENNNLIGNPSWKIDIAPWVFYILSALCFLVAGLLFTD